MAKDQYNNSRSLNQAITVSVRTMEIIQQMPDTVEHKGV